VTPARWGKGNKAKAADQGQDQTPAEQRAAMTWAQRLKRVFGIDIETRRECGGVVKVMPKALAALAGLQWQLPKRESQDAGRPDARGSRARGTG
jgi:hypothetical protein